MGHHISAFLFRGHPPVPSPLGEVPGLRFCPLAQGIVALPVTLELADDLAELPDAVGEGDGAVAPFLMLDERTSALGVLLSGGRPFAYVETEYFGGVGDQSARVWRGGEVVLSSVSINEALAELGVLPGEAVDEFEAIYLDVMRDNDDFAHGLEARLFRIYGQRLVGRYRSGRGFLHVEAVDDTIGVRGDGEFEPWRVTPSHDLESARGERLRVEYDRDGTPRIRALGDDTLWIYNDGPNLVEAFPRGRWDELAGRWASPHGDTVHLSVQRHHLFMDGVRLLPAAERILETPCGHELRLEGERRLLRDGVALSRLE